MASNAPTAPPSNASPSWAWVIPRFALIAGIRDAHDASMNPLTKNVTATATRAGRGRPESDEIVAAIPSIVAGHGLAYPDLTRGRPVLQRVARARLREPIAIHLLRRVRRQDTVSGLSAARLSALSVLVFGGPTSVG